MNLEKIIVALDQMSKEEIKEFLSQNPKLTRVKIGLELFLKHGPDFVREIHKDFGKNIFLDLKLHDIPVTVSKAISSLQGLPVEFLTVHLSGGEKMLLEAVKEARSSLPGCKMLGVSFLTSLEAEDLKSMFAITDLNAAFMRLFKLAHQTGIDGVVSSPLEVEMLKKNFPSLLSVTPGIRFEDEISGLITQDQKRIATPKEALRLGSDLLVMGRSLTKAQNLDNRLNELEKVPGTFIS